MRERIREHINTFDGEELRQILKGEDLDFEDRRLIAVYLYAVEGDFIAADQILDDLVTTYPNQPNAYISAFLVNISEGRTARAREHLAAMPEVHQKAITKKILSYQESLPTAHAASQSFGADRERFVSNILHLVSNQDWVKLYTVCYFACSDLNKDRVANMPVNAFFAYSMLKLNLKHSLIVQLQSDRLVDLNFEREALANYVRFFDGAFEEIIEVSQKFLPKKIGMSEAIFYSLMFETYADSLLRVGKPEALRELIRQDVEENGLRSWTSLFLGLAHFDSDMPKAIEYWRRAANANTFGINHSWGTNSFIANDMFRFSDHLFKPSFGIEPLKAAKTVFLACADEKYARMFAGNIFNNVESNRAVHWHYHFVLIGEDSVEDILEALEAYGNVSVSCEYHAQTLPKAYFTIGRFFLARKFVHELDAEIVVSDIDMETIDVDRALAEAWERKFRVGLHHAGFYHHFPWHAIQANLFYLDGTDACLPFLNRVISWIETNFQPSNQYQWWIDQVAVAMAIRDDAVKPTLSKLNGPFMQGFRFAGSSPDRKEAFIARLLSENRALARRMEAIMNKNAPDDP